MTQRRLIHRACVAELAVVAVLTPLPGYAPPQPRESPPARLQVVAREFELRLSRPAVPAGRVVVELANYGEDVHDLALRRDGSAVDLVRLAPALPGAARTVTVALAPGRYRLRCTIADHERRGMWAGLVVRPR